MQQDTEDASIPLPEASTAGSEHQAHYIYILQSHAGVQEHSIASDIQNSTRFNNPEATYKPHDCYDPQSTEPP